MQLKIGCVLPCRHQLLSDDDLGPLYDLLVEDPPEIRRAIGALVYDHLIAQKHNSGQSNTKGLFLLQALLYSGGGGFLFLLITFPCDDVVFRREQ